MGFFENFLSVVGKLNNEIVSEHEKKIRSMAYKFSDAEMNNAYKNSSGKTREILRQVAAEKNIKLR